MMRASANIVLLCATPLGAFTPTSRPLTAPLTAPSTTIRQPLHVLMGPFDFLNKPSPSQAPSADKNKELSSILSKDQEQWSEQDRKKLTRIASNWGDYKKPEQEDYTFFQGP